MAQHAALRPAMHTARRMAPHMARRKARGEGDGASPKERPLYRHSPIGKNNRCGRAWSLKIGCSINLTLPNFQSRPRRICGRCWREQRDKCRRVNNSPVLKCGLMVPQRRRLVCFSISLHRPPSRPSWGVGEPIHATQRHLSDASHAKFCHVNCWTDSPRYFSRNLRNQMERRVPRLK